MKDTKHTPGPWEQRRKLSGRLSIYGSVEGGPVATIEELNNTGGTPSDNANARLIAAAPDLLAEAMKAVELMKAAGIGYNETGLRAAIAKATQP